MASSAGAHKAKSTTAKKSPVARKSQPQRAKGKPTQVGTGGVEASHDEIKPVVIAAAASAKKTIRPAAGNAKKAAHAAKSRSAKQRSKKRKKNAATGSLRWGTRSLHSGMRGADVKILQTYLSDLGFRTPKTGRFDRTTARNLQRWAATLGIPGKVVDKNLARLLYAAVKGGNAPTEPPIPATTLITVTGGTSPTAPTIPALPLAPGERATLRTDGLALAPAKAPDVVKAMIAAGNKIASLPYRYGGGHGNFTDTAYDCSGSVSFLLNGGRLLKYPLDSSSFMKWGEPGPGKWVSIYTNPGHAYAVVAGLRYDTSARKGWDRSYGSRTLGTRWSSQMRSNDGYVVRHPPGL